jgi:hypothetical protein
MLQYICRTDFQQYIFVLCLIGFLAQHIDYVPTDEILDALAPQIGIELFFNLGIELGFASKS